MPCGDQRIYRIKRALIVLGDNAVEVGAVHLAVEQNDRDAQRLKLMQTALRQLVLGGDRRDDNAAQTLLTHGAKDLMLALGAFIGVEEDHVIAALVGDTRDTL